MSDPGKINKKKVKDDFEKQFDSDAEEDFESDSEQSSTSIQSNISIRIKYADHLVEEEVSD